MTKIITNYQNKIAEVALRCERGKGFILECPTNKDAHVHATYLKRAREAVARSISQARDVEIWQEGNVVNVANVRDDGIKFIPATFTSTPRTTTFEQSHHLEPVDIREVDECDQEGSIIDLSLTHDQKRVLVGLEEDFLEGKMGKEEVLENLRINGIKGMPEWLKLVD